MCVVRGLDVEYRFVHKRCGGEAKLLVLVYPYYQCSRCNMIVSPEQVDRVAKPHLIA